MAHRSSLIDHRPRSRLPRCPGGVYSWNFLWPWRSNQQQNAGKMWAKCDCGAKVRSAAPPKIIGRQGTMPPKASIHHATHPEAAHQACHSQTMPHLACPRCDPPHPVALQPAPSLPHASVPDFSVRWSPGWLVRPAAGHNKDSVWHSAWSTKLVRSIGRLAQFTWICDALPWIFRVASHSGRSPAQAHVFQNAPPLKMHTLAGFHAPHSFSACCTRLDSRHNLSPPSYSHISSHP